jgi:hypothetical protein
MSEQQAKPHWIDQLYEKHECWSYDKPGVVEAPHAGRRVRVLVPSYLTEVTPIITTESGPLLFLLGKDARKHRGEHMGVLMVAKHLDGDTYEAGIWHELFPRALKHLGLHG